MPSIVGRQVDAVGLVVGGDQEAEDVEDVVFSQMLLIDTQHIGRRGGIDLGVVVEGEAIDPLGVTEIARLVHPQDDRFGEAIETPEQIGRNDVVEIPRSDRLLHRLQQTVLADTLRSAQHQGVIDLLLRALHPVRQPRTIWLASSG